MTDAAHDHARRRGHPVELGWALTWAGQIFDYIGDPDELLKRIEEGNRVARENSLAFLTECMVPMFSGIALIRKGQLVEGMASAERGLAVWEAGGGRQGGPYIRSVLAEGVAQLGDVAGALDLIDEAIAQVERPAGKSANTMLKRSASKAGCFRARATSKQRSAPTSPRSTGPDSSRRNPGSCEPRPAMRGCCATRGARMKPTTCWRPSTVGSPRVSRPRT